MRTETRVIVEYIVYALLVIIAILTLTITALGIIAVLRYNRKRKRGDEEDSTNNSRLNLVSFIIYCTPLNVLNIPVCLSAIITFLRIFLPDFIKGLRLRLSLPCDAGNEVIQARTIIICLSTLIALSPYRDSALRMFCMHSNKTMRSAFVSLS
uniref:G-protein coupled receptors family 1 profile domain-containing protein n=1 Tax=Ascaris lumbricoides TaxID=6252 RepID=A0A9J2PZH0_ASCLU